MKATRTDDSLPVWPAMEVVGEVRRPNRGWTVTALTDLYFVGERDYLHSSTLILAADVLLSPLLGEDEAIESLENFQARKLMTHNLSLTVSVADRASPSARAAAFSAIFLTDRARSFRITGVPAADGIGRRHASPAAPAEILSKLHVEHAATSPHRARLEPLAPPYRHPPHPSVARWAVIEVILEATRQRIQERFGPLDGHRLVVAGLQNCGFEKWSAMAQGCQIDYRLSEGLLSSGTRLVHCDFAFGPHRRSGRLTIARISQRRMNDLRTPRPVQASDATR